MSSDDDTDSKMFSTQYTRGHITTVHAHAFILCKMEERVSFYKLLQKTNIQNKYIRHIELYMQD